MINAILPNCDVRVMEGIIRSLGKRKIPIIGLSTKKNCSAFYSKYITKKMISPPSRDENQFIEFLIKSVPKGVLFASDDHTAILFSEKREILDRKGFLINFPSKATLLMGFDKWLCYLQALKIGIPCAYTRLIENREDLDDMSRSMQYPFIIKATTLAGGNYIRVQRPEEVIQAFTQMESLILSKENRLLHPKLIAQEWLDYDMEDIWCVEAYYDRYGNARGFFPIKKIRTVMYRGGTYGSRLYAGESFPNEEIVSLTRKLLDGLEWKGFAHLDWVYCKKKNQYYLTEINPRLPGFSFFPSQAGFEMAYYYYADLTGESFNVPEVKPVLYFETLRYPGDISSTLSAIWRKQYTFMKLIQSYVRIFTEKKPFVMDFFCKSDMKMTLANMFNIIRTVTKEIGQMISQNVRRLLAGILRNKAHIAVNKS